MPAVVIVECGREIRTAFVAQEDANGDAYSFLAACTLAQHAVLRFIIATGPLEEPVIWPPFPLRQPLWLEVERWNRELGQGRHSQRRVLEKAIRATKRTISRPEIMATFHSNAEAMREAGVTLCVATLESLPALTDEPWEPPTERRRDRPIQLNLFGGLSAV